MAADAFAALLTADGIHVTGTPAEQKARPNARTLASTNSPPLSAIVQQMLEESNNVIAENLARQVALENNQPASYSGAAAAVTNELSHLGISTSGLHLVDGSGLSPQDEIAPATLVKTLRLATGNPKIRPLLAGLPVAGFSGTLSAGQSVFAGIGGPALGSVRAKTGNLDTVTTLAGLATDQTGRTLSSPSWPTRSRPRGCCRRPRTPSTTRPPRWPTAAAGYGRWRQHVPLDCEQHADDRLGRRDLHRNPVGQARAAGEPGRGEADGLRAT